MLQLHIQQGIQGILTVIMMYYRVTYTQHPAMTAMYVMDTAEKQGSMDVCQPQCFKTLL